jgi:hypothetical protein
MSFRISRGFYRDAVSGARQEPDWTIRKCGRFKRQPGDADRFEKSVVVQFAVFWSATTPAFGHPS